MPCLQQPQTAAQNSRTPQAHNKKIKRNSNSPQQLLLAQSHGRVPGEHKSHAYKHTACKTERHKTTALHIETCSAAVHKCLYVNINGVACMLQNRATQVTCGDEESRVCYKTTATMISHHTVVGCATLISQHIVQPEQQPQGFLDSKTYSTSATATLNVEDRNRAGYSDVNTTQCRKTDCTSRNLEPQALQKAVVESCASHIFLPLLALKKAMRVSSTDLPISKEEGLLSCMDEPLSMLSLQACMSAQCSTVQNERIADGRTSRRARSTVVGSRHPQLSCDSSPKELT